MKREVKVKRKFLIKSIEENYMWIVLNKSFLSIVKNRNDKNTLLVRARVNGDINKVFQDADVFEDANADYKYRSYIDRKIVANEISKELMNINYDNFKNSVSKDDYARSNAYMNVWSALNKMQS
jgi:hypothetical protein